MATPARSLFPLSPLRPAPAPPAAPSVPTPSRASAELWCAIELPALALEVRRAPRGKPFAVYDPGRREILAANGAARTAGVRPGQSTSTAWALCPTLVSFVRDRAAEAQALERLAGWVAQFSPRLSLEGEGLVAEIGASLRLFGGLAALLARLDAGLAALGYTAYRGVAPTPLAALWLARAGSGVSVTDPARLADALAPLPLEAMRLDPKTRAALGGLGLRRIGELMRLPCAGLARRYGRGLLDTLDRALGRSPDPRLPWHAKAVYAGTVELPVDSESLGLIDLACARLTEELAGFARARDAGVRRLTLTLETEQAIIEVPLDCHAPLSEAGRLLALLETRLERIALPAPVRKVGLRAADFAVAEPLRTFAFAGKPRRTGLSSVLARIGARLGEEVVVRLVAVPDHRPERAQRIVPATDYAGAVDLVRTGWPLLLLTSPRRLVDIGGHPADDGRLEKLGGPERIESGWWDGGDVARDYYCMRAHSGARLWVFRDRTGGSWSLHGFFV